MEVSECGVDVAKASSLGGAACLIGCLELLGLAVAGEACVAHVPALSRKEKSHSTMGLDGSIHASATCWSALPE